jgi:predicted O-methyltransferase YrrM
MLDDAMTIRENLRSISQKLGCYRQARAAMVVARVARQQFLPTKMDRLLAIDGFTQPDQLRYFEHVVRRLPEDSIIVEVGVWQGRSAIAMALACRGTRKKVYAVDPWADYVQDGMSTGEMLGRFGVSFEGIYQAFLTNRHELGVEPWLEPLRCSSQEAAKNWTRGPISFIFIDGAHDEADVAADVAAWSRLLSGSGILSGDDWNWSGVQRAVTAFIEANPGWDLSIPVARTWQLKRLPANIARQAFIVPSA